MDQTPITSLAAGHPLIDIDATVIVQFVVFLVLFAIANRFLFQPYLRLRERRRAGIEGARAEATRMTAQADAALADYEKRLAVARDSANEESRKIRAEASRIQQAETQSAHAQAQAALEKAQATVRAETEAARGQLLPQADALARSIASKLLGREVA